MRTTATALATATIAVLLTAAPAQAADLQPPSRPQSVVIFGGDAGDQIRVGWGEATRTGSRPIRRYVIRWTGHRMVVPASISDVIVGDLDPGRYVFKVKAVSRAGSSPWARSRAVYVD